MPESLYVGRIVMVGQTPSGALCAGYRVSSRSFPNRTAVLGDGKVSIVPKPGFEGDVQKNPYIAYNCVRIVQDGAVAVATNGGQTDPIAEKIAMGMPVRDALALTHLAMDYEKDQYNTPRISAVADRRDESLWLAIVRDNGLEVQAFALERGRCRYVATYEENSIRETQGDALAAESADALCDYLLSGGVFARRLNPVTAVAAVDEDGVFTLAAKDMPEA